MKICLIQLPLVDPHYSSLEANIPLAGAYLKSYWENLDPLKSVKIDFLPQKLGNFGGDASILQWLEARAYEVYAFTVFMWNMERSLYLAEKIKEKNPHTFIIFGGPEISEGSPALKSPFVDTFVSGEGEKQFARIIDKIIHHEPLPLYCRESEPLNLSTIPNPYLSKTLKPQTGSILHLETMRGCPFSCAYCYYPKSVHEIRFFPEERIPDFFDYARQHDSKEIYIMDPSFNSSSRFIERLKQIKKSNPTRIPLHTEIRLENITPLSASLMQEAGFISVEAGLQTTNPIALKKISRHFNCEKFLQGAGLLQDKNIEIRTGAILGLPGDTLDDFSKTLDFLLSYQLDAHAEIYPLSLLPGSTLLSRSQKIGVSHQSLPPYFVLKTPEMSSSDLSKAVLLIRDKLGKELFSPVSPCFRNQEDLIRFLDLKIPSQLKLLLDSPQRMANSLSLLINKEICQKTSLMEKIALKLRKSNPFTLVQIIIEEQDPLSESLFKDLKSLFYHEQYFDRINAFNDDHQKCYSTRFFQLSGQWNSIDFLEQNKLPFDPVFHYSSGERRLHLKPLLEINLPMILAEYEQLTPKEMLTLNKIYRDFPEFLLLK